VSTSLWRRSAPACVIGLFAVLLFGCVVAGGGYGYDGGAGYGLGYYEPTGVNYGGWGPDYQVAPFRRDHRADAGGGRASPHAYRAAPASRSVPSIPSGSRSGGGGGRGSKQR
jgi:hypothetical protein